MTLQGPFTHWQRDDHHGRIPVLTSVWLQLDQLFPRSPDATRHVIETGLDITGRVRANLHGRFPSVDGRWLGCPPGLKLTIDRWFLAGCDDNRDPGTLRARVL